VDGGQLENIHPVLTLDSQDLVCVLEPVEEEPLHVAVADELIIWKSREIHDWITRNYVKFLHQSKPQTTNTNLERAHCFALQTPTLDL
jgi:hypothetical protein